MRECVISMELTIGGNGNNFGLTLHHNSGKQVTTPSRKCKAIVTVSRTLAGLALQSKLKINEKEVPKNLQSTTGGAVPKR